MFEGFLGSIFLFILILAIVLPIIMLVETFKMFNNIKDIKENLINQNEEIINNQDAIIKLLIEFKNKKTN